MEHERMKFVLKILKSFYLIWKKSLTTTGIGDVSPPLLLHPFIPANEGNCTSSDIQELLLLSPKILSVTFFKNALKSSYFVGQYIIIRRKTGLRGSRLLFSSYCQPILQSESDRCTWTEWKESIMPRFSSSIQNPCKKKNSLGIVEV